MPSPTFSCRVGLAVLIVVIVWTSLQRLSPSTLPSRLRSRGKGFVVASHGSGPRPGHHQEATTTVTMSDVRSSRDPDPVVVSVRFYGESMCPYCREFVTEAWPPVWEDEGIRPHLDYDMIAWGNAYFATEECGGGPYSPDERACWYKKCIPTSGGFGADVVAMDRNGDAWSHHETAETGDCFAGPAVYQHGEREAVVDVYETCVKEDYGLDVAVTFTYCAEGTIMDNDHLDAEQLMRVCTVSLNGVDSDQVQHCYETRRRDLEVANAKVTPAHPGVPYVLVDGEALNDPLQVKKAICDRLQAKGVQGGDFPESCREA